MVLGETAQHGLCALRGSSWVPHLHLQPHPSRKQSLHSANKWYGATHLRAIVSESPPGGLLSIGTSLLPVFLPSGHPASYCPAESMCFCLFSLVSSPSCPPPISAQSQVDRQAPISRLTAWAFFAAPATILYTDYLLLSPPRERSPWEQGLWLSFIPESSPLAEW